LVVDHSLIN